MTGKTLSLKEIIEFLDVCFEVEFSFIKSEEPAALIARQTPENQDFILKLTRRVATTNQELAFQFAMNASKALELMDQHMVEAWAMKATDNYDRKGLIPAMTVIRDLDNYIQHAHISACGAVLDDEMPVLLPFAQGMSGRKLKIAATEGNEAYTDTETIFLPAINALFKEAKDNFLIYKASIAFLWAQIQFGTFRIQFEMFLDCDNPQQQLKKFFALETIRLETYIKRELPGLYRDMQALKQKQEELTDHLHTEIKQWQTVKEQLTAENASIHDTLECMVLIDENQVPAPYCYHGTLKLGQAREIMHKRIEKEKAYFRIALSELAKEGMDNKHNSPDNAETELDSDSRAKFELNYKKQAHNEQLINSGVIELQLDGELMPLPDHVKELMTSIIIDFGEIPPDYLYAAGPGEYDLKKYEEEQLNPDEVWQGTYHEEGAEIYNEWNFKRQHYHKNWCVLRELELEPKYDDFVKNTLLKHKTLLKKLRHSFEVLRGEDRLLKKQVHGDNIDIDALVEAYGDVKSGMEMSERLFTKMHKVERNVAVIFMVDMSGSTRGWINTAERESLILLSEVIQILGDRFAIYGFSGMTRQRCELYKIKSFDEDYNDEIKARISNIEPQN